MSKKHEDVLKSLGVQHVTDRFGRRSFRPQGKTEHRAPVIIETYYEEEVDEDGKSNFTRMYKCEPHPGEQEPRIFKADRYDEVFMPETDLRRIKRK
jgi:hypothetical protein